MERKRMFEL